MSLAARLDQTADIERATPSVGATGEVTLAWTPIAAGVPCALCPRSSILRAAIPGLRHATTHVAWFPPGTDLRPDAAQALGDRVVVDGALYRVLNVEDVAHRGRLLRAELAKEA